MPICVGDDGAIRHESNLAAPAFRSRASRARHWLGADSPLGDTETASSIRGAGEIQIAGSRPDSGPRADAMAAFRRDRVLNLHGADCHRGVLARLDVH